MVGHRRKSDRAEEDRLVAADLLEPIHGHHAAVLRVVVAAPGLLVPLECEPELAARRLQHALAFGDHFLADSIAGDDRDSVRAIGLLFSHSKNLSNSSHTRSGTSSGR